MIGLLLHGMGLGFPFPSGTGILAGVVACCALFGLYKLSQCRLRHCGCCRWLLRSTGSDPFSDFELMVFVHEVSFMSCSQKLATKVRVTAGDQEVSTDKSTNKQFHQPLLVLVEQGVETVQIEVMDASKGRPLAKWEVNVVSDILKSKSLGQRKKVAMKEVSKQITDMRLTVTLQDNSQTDEEKGLLEDMVDEDAMDDHTRLIMKAHLASAQQELAEEEGVALPQEVQKMRIVAKGCCGVVDVVGGWGGRNKEYLAVQGPPEHKKFRLALWSSEQEYEKDSQPSKEIQLLRVRAVAAHPQSDQAFVVSHFISPQQKEDLLLYSTDRNRQVWVESLSLLVKMMHEMRDDKKSGKRKKTQSDA